MDWTLALERNHDILLRNVAWLFTWLGMKVGESVVTLPKHKRLALLFVLRSAESACRRLAMVAMYVRGVTAPKVKARSVRPAKKVSAETGEKAARSVPPAFQLTDPRKKFDLNPNGLKRIKGPGPRITDFWSDDPIYDRSDLYAYQERLKRLRESTGGEEEGAKSVCCRMNALMAALQDLDRQAVRMARLLARNKHRREIENKPALYPIRPGVAPGQRQRTKHEVDDVLKEAHLLAFIARNEFPPP